MYSWGYLILLYLYNVFLSISFSTPSSVTLIAWNEPWWEYLHHGAFQVALVVKNPPVNAGDIKDVGLIPGLGRFRGGGHSNPLQYSCLENSSDWGAWWAIVHRIAQSRTLLKWLSTYGHWQGLTIRVYFLAKGKFLNISQHTADPGNHDSVYQKLLSKNQQKHPMMYVHHRMYHSTWYILWKFKIHYDFNE